MLFVKSVIARASQTAVFWSLIAIGFRLAGGVIVLPLVVRKLPTDHLGLWYVFLSLQGIASLFDLGFSPAVTRAAGYIWAGARELKKFGVAQISGVLPVEATPNYGLLSGLVATMRLYYRVFGIASGIIMLFGGGAWVWIKTAHLPDATNLRFCYAAFVCGGFLNATGDLWPALLSGINGVQRAQKILLGSAVINFVVAAGGLLAHLGIWALVIATLASGLFLRLRGRVAFFDLVGGRLDSHARRHLDLISKLWPTAWRSGLVSLGGFLVISANTLICSALLDLKVTASYGLTLSLIATLTAACSTFTQIKLPLVNQLRAAGQTDDIIRLWIQRTRLTVVCFAIGGLVLLVTGSPALRIIGSKTMLLPGGPLALALVIMGLEMHHSLYAGLIISENQNPFVVPALISGGATVLLSVLLTPYLGVWGLLLAQGCTQACFNNWWTVYRAIHGLGLSWMGYWRRYFSTPIQAFH